MKKLLSTRPKKITLALLGLLFAALPLCGALSSQHASALTGSNFNAGRIIDNVVFTDAGSMSVQNIQAFLNAKVGTCDNNGTGSAAPYNSGMTRAAYDASIGRNTKFTCINQYYENTTTLANNLDGNAIPAGAISAAQIIYNASVQYQINPQVLIATIQKEQGLVTDTWPWDSEYQGALGYACPDSAPCNSEYYGFYNQVNNAAAQFRRYLTNPNNYNYVVGNDSILYSPAGGCGSSIVNVQNQATAALYDYTPYQPNAGALSNVTDSSAGGSDGGTCGAYGNRNFWWYFNEWFGSSLAPNYGWVSQDYAITDMSGTAVDPGFLQPGQEYTATLGALNTGSTTWTNGGPHPINLATTFPTGHNSGFCNSTWLSCSRPATLQEASVAPGAIGHFVFNFYAPTVVGSYYDNFKPVAEMLAWFNDSPPGETFGIRVVSPGTFSWSAAGYQIFDQSSNRVDPGQLQPGQTYTATLVATNTGTATWYNNGAIPVRLATSEPTSRMSSLCNATWIACNRPAGLTESSVAPGQTGHFTFTFQAPFTVGGYYEAFKPVAENFAWFNDADPGDSFGVHVASPGTFSWSTTGYVVKDQSGTQVDPSQVRTGQAYTVTLPALNTGTATWYNNGPIPIHLATSNPTSRTSSLCNNTWMACNRPAGLTESSVAPGQTGHFTFTFTAPTQLGPDREWFKPVAENFAWFNDAPYNEVGIVVIP